MKYSTLLFSIIIVVLFIQPIQLQAQDNHDLNFRKWRITLFPPISTNGVDAPHYSARYSINILGGYNGALDGFEVGGLVNYNKYYAHGFQIVGGANATSGEMAGINLAGITNISKSDMTGIQVAGIANISGEELEGIQGAGVFNIAGDVVTGLQLAGVGNIGIKDLEGLQVAGTFNASLGEISGLQIAGITNLAYKDIDGFQTSGFLNYAGSNISGLQITGGANIAMGDIDGLMISGGVNFANREAGGLLISGLANIAMDLDGLQISTVNLAREAAGVQIGLVNVAKEFNGLPVGLISLYGNGRKNLDVRYNDAGFTDLGITLGTYRVYNMAIVGYNTLLERNVYRVGWAIGLEKNIQDAFPTFKSESVYVNQEFSMYHHFEEEWTRRLNRIYSYNYNIGKRFGNGLSIYGGPSFNMQVSRVAGASDYSWYSIWSPSAKGREYRFWVGVNVGIRLFKQKTMKLLRNQNANDNWELDW